jgi:RimJ/RimL family protein N-acetyltransferase
MDTNPLGQPIGWPVIGWKPPPLPVRERMEGRYCRLEPLDPALHARSLFEADSLDQDGRTWTYLAYGPFETLESYRAWIEQECMGADPLFFAIVDRKTERAAGVASYLRIAPASGSIEVGHIHLSPLLQRTPAATEAMFLMMERAFTLGYRRYEWKCDALNAASRAAAKGSSARRASTRAGTVTRRGTPSSTWSGRRWRWPSGSGSTRRTSARMASSAPGSPSSQDPTSTAAADPQAARP